MVAEKNLEKYKKILSEMKVENDDLDFLPYCPILMLGIIDMAGFKHGHNNKWRWNENYMEEHFHECWEKYVGQRKSTRADYDLAFSRMKYEPFCTYWPDGSIKFDDQLYLLIRDDDSRSILRKTIINCYFPICKVNFGELNPMADNSLRPYQVEAKKKVFDFLKDNKRVMLQMPTGTGKTRLFVSIVRDLHNWGVEHKKAVKVLILAHRRELIDQIDTELGVKYGLAHGIIMSQNAENKKYPVQVGCVPTMQRRIDDWGDKDFDLIIIDEAHHVKADSYKQIIKKYPNAKLLGLTATPYRLNGAGFTKEFDGLLLSEPVKWFIDNHYLCDYVYYSIKPDSDTQESIDKITKFALDGDYAESSMMSVMDDEHVRANIVDTYLKFAKGKKGIVYCINKEHNQHVCSRYNQLGVKAAAIDCNTPKDEREKIVKQFRKGEIKVLCNVNIFSEGFDCPDVEFIQLARPTKSLSMYLQQSGRGLRPAQGKDKVIFLDNVGLYNKFGFPSARRKWQHHFDGKDVEDVARQSEGGVEHEVRFFEEVEGKEEVHEIYSTQKEETTDLALKNYEPEFLDYCKATGFKSGIQYVNYIKKYVDAYIREKIDSSFNSLFNLIDVDELNRLRIEFQRRKETNELPAHRFITFKSMINKYLEFANHFAAMSVPSIPPQIEINQNYTNNIDSNIKHSEKDMGKEELLKEMAVFQKYNIEVPAELLDKIQQIERQNVQNRLEEMIAATAKECGIYRRLELLVYQEGEILISNYSDYFDGHRLAVLKGETAIFEKYHTNTPDSILTEIAEMESIKLFNESIQNKMNDLRAEVSVDKDYLVRLSPNGQVSIEVAFFNSNYQSQQQSIIESEPDMQKQSLTKSKPVIQKQSLTKSKPVIQQEPSTKRESILISGRVLDKSLNEQGYIGVSQNCFASILPYLTLERKYDNTSVYDVDLYFGHRTYGAKFFCTGYDSGKKKMIILDWNNSGFDTKVKQLLFDTYKRNPLLSFEFDTVDKRVVVKISDNI